MNETVLPNNDYFGEYSATKRDIKTAQQISTHSTAHTSPYIAPFFSMRKLRLIYNELATSTEFEYTTFDAFKHQVLNSVAPQLELNKWQAIAARR
ncbi:MAG: hypothetical protein ACJAVV_001008 [Alphaproteobacteria bacterium]|jgi:hypothetical protein